MVADEILQPSAALVKPSGGLIEIIDNGTAADGRHVALAEGKGSAGHHVAISAFEDRRTSNRETSRLLRRPLFI